MPAYVAILRGINVSGQKKIKMDSLQALFEKLGMSQVTTYIQSGNIVFISKLSKQAELQRIIEDGIKKEYGFSVPVLLLTKSQLKKAIKDNPYPEDNIDAKKLYFTFVDKKPSKINIDKLNLTDIKGDEYQIINNVVYVYCHGSYGKTKLSNTFLEKTLQINATTRNWNSVNKLAEIIESY